MEEALIVFIVFGSVIATIKMILEYSKWKRTHQQNITKTIAELPGESLGMSELREMIHEAVEEAQLPLMARINTLEKQLPAPALPPAESKDEA